MKNRNTFYAIGIAIVAIVFLYYHVLKTDATSNPTIAQESSNQNSDVQSRMVDESKKSESSPEVKLSIINEGTSQPTKNNIKRFTAILKSLHSRYLTAQSRT